MLKKILYSPFTRMFAGFIFIILVFSLIAWGLRSFFELIDVPSFLKQSVSNIVLTGAILASYVGLYRWYEKRRITELSLHLFLRDMAGGLLVGFLFLSVVVFVIYLFGEYTVIGINPGIFLLSAFLGCLLIGVLEEILLRGIVFRLVEEKLGTWISMLLSAFLFGFLHIWNPGATVLSSVAIALEAGILLAAAYVLTRNLWFPIFIHAAWNFTGSFIYGVPISGGAPGESLLVSQIGGSEWITGGAFGPENSIQAMILGLIVGSIFLWFAWKKGHFIEPFWSKKTSSIDDTPDTPEITSGDVLEDA